MNKRTRLIVSLLFIIIIILATAITRFYVNVPENMQSDSNQTEIVNTVDSDGAGNIIFSDGKGSFGIADSVRITAAPEWQELKFTGKGRCIASKKTGGELLCGCIDYDGNVVTPFIYREITRYIISGFTVYSAESASDNSFVLYNEDFMPLFRCSWDSCTFGDNELVLADDSGIYTFLVDSDRLIFKSASVSGEVMDCSYILSLHSRVFLSKLSPPMIEKMLSDAEKYLEFAYTLNDDCLTEIVSGNRSSFVPAFRGEKNIISRKLTGISSVNIYSVISDDGIPKYDVSVNADTEIVYNDESGSEKSFTDNYRISVKFSGSSESDLYAVSGKFELDSPVYPAPESDEENSVQDMSDGD